MAFAPGDRFDRYRIEAVVGEGGMGRVYRAYDEHLHRNVALKVVRGDRSTDEDASLEAAARLLQEARAAAALDHPNAVSVFDAAEVDGTIYIAMEYVDGTSLRAFVPPHGEATYELRLRWLVDVARALAAAHERGLVHRDVKPENVLVRRDGVVKVLDFGIAKRVGGVTLPERESKATESGQFVGVETAAGRLVGTPRYMAPEQVRGEVVDARADQFAWGVLAYEMLTGNVPWADAHDGPKLFAAVLHAEVPPLALPGLPALVGEVLAVTLRKRREERFPSMHDVVHALEPLLHVSGSMARPAVIRTSNSVPAPPDAETRLALEATPRVRSRSRPLAWVLASVTALALAAFAWRSRAPHALVAAPHASSSTSSEPSIARFAVGQHPVPLAVKPDAAAAYRAALQAFRDASFDAIRQSLERATTLDPTFGAAHLRAALMSSLVSSEEQEARRSFKNATSFRATMDERDRRLLDAFDPYFQLDPSDFAEAETRMARVVADFPGDAEAWFWLGYVRFDRGLLPEALEAFSRATEIDPEFALALSNQGGILAYLGRFPESLKVLDRCLAVSPAATDCVWYRVLMAEQEGRCADADADLHRWIAKDPEDYYAYQMLAKTLFAEGKPHDAVLEAYAQKWQRLGSGKRARSETLDRARLEVMAGRFANVEKLLRDTEAAVSTENGALAHAYPAHLLVQLYEEEGRAADARAVAEAFLERRDAWTHPHRIDDRAIAEDVTLAMEATLARTGAHSKADFAARRDAWVTAWKARTGGSYVGFLWLSAWAAPAETREDAIAALAALPSFGALPPFFPQELSLAHVAKVQALAGHDAEALPLLRRANAVCLALEDPFVHTQNALHLGEALERSGDAKGACDAYDLVLSRWGSAKPKSITADEARARSSAIGCRK